MWRGLCISLSKKLYDLLPGDKIMKTKLPFILTHDKKENNLTAYAGLPLVCELWHALHMDRKIKKILDPKLKGFSHSDVLKSLVCLVITGGDCADDIRMLNQDKAFLKLAQMDELPSASTILRYLKRSHQDYQPVVGESFVPQENDVLKELGLLSRCVAAQMIQRSGLKTITIENDATVILSQKQEALIGYKGQGYMPTLAVIPELDLVIADEFRDGNVAPKYDPLGFFKKSLLTIPKSVTKVRTRLDGAYYQHDFMWFLEKKNIAYTISADKSEALLKAIQAIPQENWKTLVDQDGVDTGKDYTELYWTPTQSSRKRSKESCRRYLVTRVRRVQGILEGVYTAKEKKEKIKEQELNRYEAIVSNINQDPADRLIFWHHKKGGHIEKVHDRIKNDLAGGKMPCAEFGANAAWFRINCLAWNMVRILQIEALPQAFQTCYLKKLRLWLFNIAGRVVESGRQLTLKLSACCEESFRIYERARMKLACLGDSS
jgi:hypothetical protein